MGPIGPNMVAWLDDGLRCLASAALSEQAKLPAELLLSGFVRNEVTLSLDLRTAVGDGKVMPGYGTMLGRLIDPDRFPALQRAIDSGSLDDDDDMESESAWPHSVRVAVPDDRCAPHSPTIRRPRWSAGRRGRAVRGQVARAETRRTGGLPACVKPAAPERHVRQSRCPTAARF
jgi:hypothetical protein